MKKLSLLTVLFLYGIFSLSAQTKNAEEILNELTTKTNSYKNIKVSFAYKMSNESAGIDETTNGTLLMSGDQYSLSIAGQEIISDGITIWTYLADSEEVQINEKDGDEGFSPTKLLSSYTDDYSAKLKDEVKRDGKILYQLELKPKEKNSNFDYVILMVDKTKMQLSDFIIHDFDDNIFSYEIKQFITDTDIPASSFTFDSAQYPDVEVIDMR